MSLILLPVSWNWIMRIFCFRLILSGLKSIDTQWFWVEFSLVINDNLFNFVIMFHVMTTARRWTTDYMCYVVAIGFCNIHARIQNIIRRGWGGGSKGYLWWWEREGVRGLFPITLLWKLTFYFYGEGVYPDPRMWIEVDDNTWQCRL